MSNAPNRRDFLKSTCLAAAGPALSPLLSRFGRGADAPAEIPRKRILFFAKSSGFQHTVIARDKDHPEKLAFAEQILTDLGARRGFDVTCSKDGGIFAPASRDSFDAFVFYTTRDLTTAGVDGQPPMSPADKAGLLDAIHNGKGFVGIHSASDTFLATTPVGKDLLRNIDEHGQDNFDPYIKMLGGEFISHSKQQQETTLRCVDEKFPGAAAFKDARFVEEWYSLKNFAPDLHVILVQETAGMTGDQYVRKPYPETWARMHGKGRVFYTSLGHREDVWQKPAFQDLLIGALSWSTGRIDADMTPNIKQVTPEADPKPFPQEADDKVTK
jgi:type 1 glutamine amidotransferase